MLVAAAVLVVTVLLVCSPDDADDDDDCDDAGDIDEVGVAVAFAVASARIRLIGSSTTTHMHTAAPKLMAARPKYETKKPDSDQ
jgi:hypothetical protein